jgi:hypothetical protein
VAISYNTGAKNSANNATSVTLAIPAGVLAGDVMLMALEVFTVTSSAPSISFSGAGGSWTLVPVTSGVNPEVAVGGGISSYGFAYYRVATAGDIGATLTITESGVAAGSTWFAVAMASYTGASTTAPIDVATGNNAQGTASGTAPSATTVTANDWAVYLACAGVGAGPLAGPGTSRQNIVSSASVAAAVDDSNGSVGSSGTSIGGGSWTQAGGTGDWWSLFTIGLAPAGGAVVPAPVYPPLIPYPLWEQVLETAAYRIAVAPAVASLQQQHWRLMDGVNGRPGSGPGTATGTGSNINGTCFYVTQGGMWLEGYWWWVCPSGGQSAGPQKFCLYSVIPGGGAVVPGSVVTSGTLSTGWNWIPLPQPVQLAIWGQYEAVTGISGPYPATINQFNSGGPYAAGITSGPLTAFSDNNGSNPAPYTFGNGVTTAGTDPAQTQPGSDSNNGYNFWVDVQVTNTAPAGYTGSYRLWPNMRDADYQTGNDSPVNYVIGTEILLSQACVVSAIWYFLPGGTAQFATSADIWRVRDGVRVATQPTPVWTTWGGGRAALGTGQWIRCELPGVTIPAGDYYVTVYNSNATPDAWSVKRLAYWQQGGLNLPNDGTYLHMPPGASGITNGPLYAPTTPLASDIADYTNPAQVEPGQSVFAVGPPNQVPNRYVGAANGQQALFQNYWVDIEVTPANLYVSEAPTPPQTWSPYWEQFAEIAAYRMDGAPPPVQVVHMETLSASLLVSGSMARQAAKVLAAVLAVTATLARSLARVLAASLAVTGTLLRQVARTLPASAVVTGTSARQAGKPLSVSAVTTAVVALVKVRVLTLAAALGVSGAVTRQAGKALASPVAAVASLGRAIGRTLSAAAVTTAQFFTGSGHIYALTLTAGATASAALTAAASYLAAMFSTGTAFFRWATGTIRQRWGTGGPRNQ